MIDIYKYVYEIELNCFHHLHIMKIENLRVLVAVARYGYVRTVILMFYKSVTLLTQWLNCYETASKSNSFLGKDIGR